MIAKKSRLVVVVASIGIIGIVSAVLLILSVTNNNQSTLNTDSSQANTCTTGDNSEVLRKANSIFNGTSEDFTTTEVIDDIEAFSLDEEKPVCLFLLTRLYLLEQKPDKAVEYYNLLKESQGYINGTVVKENTGAHYLNTQQIEQLIDIAQQQADSFQIRRGINDPYPGQ